MAAATRPYAVKDTEDNVLVVVEAQNPVQAERHVMAGRIKATPLSDVETARLLQQGVKYEIARKDQQTADLPLEPQ